MKLHRDKKPFKILRKWKDGGCTFVEYESDLWQGPCCSDRSCTCGCVETGYFTVLSVARSDQSFSGIKTCSFWPELRKALGVA